MKHATLVRPRTGYIVKCACCSKEIYIRPSALRVKNYCSHKCASRGMRTGEICICKICNKEYYRSPSQVKWRGTNYCSKKCMGQYLRTLKGEKSLSWEGGKSSIYRRLRSGIEFTEWRKAVFERDDYICQKCGARSSPNSKVRLHPHHKKSFTLYPELRFEISNGETLCERCHKEEHNEKKGNRKA